METERSQSRDRRSDGLTIALSILAVLLLPSFTSCVGDPESQAVHAEDVYLSFVANGLEAGNPHAITNEEFAIVAKLCRGAFFYIPSLSGNAGGHIIECNSPEEIYYIVLFVFNMEDVGKWPLSWLIVKRNILVQIDGRLPEALAGRYAQAIPGAGGAAIRRPPAADLPEAGPSNPGAATDAQVAPASDGAAEVSPAADALTENPPVLPILPTVTPPGDCSPYYPDVCLAEGTGDFDCAGGSGNGPSYAAGPIRV